MIKFALIFVGMIAVVAAISGGVIAEMYGDERIIGAVVGILVAIFLFLVVLFFIQD